MLAYSQTQRQPQQEPKAKQINLIPIITGLPRKKRHNIDESCSSNRSDQAYGLPLSETVDREFEVCSEIKVSAVSLQLVSHISGGESDD